MAGVRPRAHGELPFVHTKSPSRNGGKRRGRRGIRRDGSRGEGRGKKGEEGKQGKEGVGR